LLNAKRLYQEHSIFDKREDEIDTDKHRCDGLARIESVSIRCTRVDPRRMVFLAGKLPDPAPVCVSQNCQWFCYCQVEAIATAFIFRQILCAPEAATTTRKFNLNLTESLFAFNLAALHCRCSQIFLRPNTTIPLGLKYSTGRRVEFVFIRSKGEIVRHQKPFTRFLFQGTAVLCAFLLWATSDQPAVSESVQR
jgi:hypothetical protein